MKVLKHLGFYAPNYHWHTESGAIADNEMKRGVNKRLKHLESYMRKFTPTSLPKYQHRALVYVRSENMMT